MGWLIQYVGPDGAIVRVPDMGDATVRNGDTFDLRPSPEVRALVANPESPWRRVARAEPDLPTPRPSNAG